MKNSSILQRAALIGGLMLAAAPVCAEQGVDRAVNGGTQTVTSPIRVFEGIQQETNAHGPVGVVTGSLKGGAAAAGQAVTGAANIGIGVVETLLSPFRN